jgi:hypothetical protein
MPMTQPASCPPSQWVGSRVVGVQIFPTCKKHRLMLQYTIIRHLREHKGSKYTHADSSDHGDWAGWRFELRRRYHARCAYSIVNHLAYRQNLPVGGGDFCFRLPPPSPRAANFKVVKSWRVITRLGRPRENSVRVYVWEKGREGERRGGDIMCACCVFISHSKNLTTSELKRQHDH